MTLEIFLLCEYRICTQWLLLVTTSNLLKLKNIFFLNGLDAHCPFYKILIMLIPISIYFSFNFLRSELINSGKGGEKPREADGVFELLLLERIHEEWIDIRDGWIEFPLEDTASYAVELNSMKPKKNINDFRSSSEMWKFTAKAKYRIPVSTVRDSRTKVYCVAIIHLELGLIPWMDQWERLTHEFPWAHASFALWYCFVFGFYLFISPNDNKKQELCCGEIRYDFNKIMKHAQNLPEAILVKFSLHVIRVSLDTFLVISVKNVKKIWKIKGKMTYNSVQCSMFTVQHKKYLLPRPKFGLAKYYIFG